MSLLWDLALVLQLKTEAEDCLTFSWQSANAETLILDNGLKFSLLYFLLTFLISYHVN